MMNDITLNVAYKVWLEDLYKLFLIKGMFTREELDSFDFSLFYGYFSVGHSVEETYAEEFDDWY